MSDNQFQAGGPLLADSLAYLERKADHAAVRQLRQMQYITLIEPRQSGKTSLINHLSGQFSGEGYNFAIRDLTAEKPREASMQEWFQSLGQHLLDQLTFIPSEQKLALPGDIKAWESYLDGIAKCAMHARRKVVIVLDEIGAMPKEAWATDFFAVIRSIYTTRQTIPARQHLSFVIAGVFNPKELIQDKSISEFNITQQIHLEDFEIDDIKKLVSRLQLADDVAAVITERVYYWADGQPYLSQRLCSYLHEEQNLEQLSAIYPESQSSLRKRFSTFALGDIHSSLGSGLAAAVGKIVDEVMWRLFRDDTLHLTRVKEIVTQPDLLAYTRQITRESTRFTPALNDKQFHLAHVNGIIKANPEGFCKIRNRVYEQALSELEKNIHPFIDSRASSEPVERSEIDRIRNYCQDALVREFALAWAFEKRAMHYSWALHLIEYSTWATLVVIGSIALSIGVDFPAFKYILWVVAGIALCVPIIDLWARTAHWKDLQIFALESSQRHRKLIDGYATLANTQIFGVRKLKSEVEAWDQEAKQANDLDDNQIIMADKEIRRGRHAALLHFQSTCPTCKKIPTSMKASKCAWCGNF